VFVWACMCACAPRVQLDNNISGLAPNTGMPVCYAPPVETGPRHKGGELLEPPSLTTTPQRSNPWSPSYSGGIEVEVEVSNRKKSTSVWSILSKIIIIIIVLST